MLTDGLGKFSRFTLIDLIRNVGRCPVVVHVLPRPDGKGDDGKGDVGKIVKYFNAGRETVTPFLRH